MTDQSAGPGFATLALHAGTAADAPLAAGASLIDRSGAAIFEDLEQAAALFGLEGFGQDFSPSLDPTNALLEERIAALEGGTAALAIASGKAARLVALHMLLQPGDAVIAGTRRAGVALHQIDAAFEPFGWRVDWADPQDPESFDKLLSPQTRAILIESLAPCGLVADIAAIAAIAKKARVPLIVDNTHATPYLLRPFEHGADIVIHSTAKFLGGQDTLNGGMLVDSGNFPWQNDARFPMLSAPRPDFGGIVFAETFGNFAFAIAARILGLQELGPTLSPFNAFLILNGLDTLALRMQRHSDTALRAAEFLAKHENVRAVDYAGLAGDRSHERARIYCPSGAGAGIMCHLAGGYDAAVAFTQRLKLFSGLGETGDSRSRASHPASTTHRHLRDADKAAAGVGPDVVRLSIGLEDVNDILADLDQALSAG